MREPFFKTRHSMRQEYADMKQARPLRQASLTAAFAVVLLVLPFITNLDHITAANMPAAMTHGAPAAPGAHH